MPVLLKNVPHETLKVTHYINSKTRVHLCFHILRDDIRRSWSTLLHSKVQWLPQGKAFMFSFELQGELSACFGDHYFHIVSLCGTLERASDKLWLFNLGYLADISSKMNKVSQTTSRKTTDSVCWQSYNSGFWMKIRILKIFYLPPWSQPLPSTDLMTLVGLILKVILWECVMKCVSI